MRIRNASLYFRANLHNIYIFPFLDVKARHLVQYLLNFSWVQFVCIICFVPKVLSFLWTLYFCKKNLPWALVWIMCFLDEDKLKFRVRSWGWFTMLNPISKSFRQCLIQNDFANITMKCRICNNEEKCLLCCFDSGLLTITF